MAKRSKDNSAPGQGVDGSKDENWYTKNIDREKEKMMYGDGADLTPKHNSKT